MFVIINIVETGKKKIKKGKTVSSVRDFHMSGGERFYIVDVCDSEKGVNWDDVSYFIGKHGKRVLMDEKFSFSEFSALERFNAKKFRNLLLFNTLEIVLREMYLSGIRIRCVINDPRGLYVHNLSKIARFSAQTTVVTENNIRYFSEICDMYAKFGAGITVTDVIPEADEKTFVIDTTGELDFCGKGYLFSPVKGIRPLNADGFSHIKALCPSYIDTIDFLGAVYELNKDESLDCACCSSLFFKNRKCSVSEMTDEIKCDVSAFFDNNKSIIFYL